MTWHENAKETDTRQTSCAVLPALRNGGNFYFQMLNTSLKQNWSSLDGEETRLFCHGSFKSVLHANSEQKKIFNWQRIHLSFCNVGRLPCTSVMTCNYSFHSSLKVIACFHSTAFVTVIGQNLTQAPSFTCKSAVTHTGILFSSLSRRIRTQFSTIYVFLTF